MVRYTVCYIMAYDPERITFFAKTDARGQNVPFGIRAKDRTRHVYVIGKTGMGKSTLLENMAVQDMQQGNGLAFIDPHGATAETLLSYVPEERVDDVLYFAPFDTQHPIAFNVMEDVGPEKRHLVAAGLMSVFKKIWVDAWSARMEYILQNTLLALLEFPNSTLLGVNRMLSDKDYRKAVVENIADPAVKTFWVDEFAKYNERYMQEAGDAIKNKIGQFTANPLIRNIIGQPHTSFDLRQIMDEQKILIVNLSKGLVGEGNANLLGSMLTTRIYLAAMSRADLAPAQMQQTPNFYFYVDEFQSFANATFSDILSEARKYHLNLTIAHQYIEQMEEEVRSAVFGNVGTIVSFRVGPFDAETLETIFAPQFYAVDIVNLGFAQIYLTLMIDGIGSRPFSAVTLPPIETPQKSCLDMVVARSRGRFGSERQAVENTINTWMRHSYTLTSTTEKTSQKNYQSANSTEQKNSRSEKNRFAKKPAYDISKANNKFTTPSSKSSTTKTLTIQPPTNEPTIKQPTPNLAELRGVLRSIADAEEKHAEATAQTQKSPQQLSKSSQKSKNDVPKESLKDALAVALANTDTKTKPLATPTPTASTQLAPSPTTSTPSPVAVADSSPPPEAPPTVLETANPPPTAGISPPPDPQKIARMLAESDADQSPFTK